MTTAEHIILQNTVQIPNNAPVKVQSRSQDPNIFITFKGLARKAIKGCAVIYL